VHVSSPLIFLEAFPPVVKNVKKKKSGSKKLSPKFPFQVPKENRPDF